MSFALNILTRLIGHNSQLVGFFSLCPP